MMTEQEAKEKWCPHARVVTENSNKLSAYNRKKNGGEFYDCPSKSRCIGSRCMSWRWMDAIIDITPKIKRGYCGLAGKP